MNVRLDYGQRLAIIGQAGTGKSTLALRIAAGLRRAVVLDPKHEIELPGYAVARRPEELRDGERLIYRPGLDWRPEELDAVCRVIFERGNMWLVADETLPLARAAPRAPYVGAIYRLGRSRGVGAISLTQRPAWIPLEMLSESQHLAIFRLALAEDVSRVAQLAGRPELRTGDPERGWPPLPELPDHWYYWVRLGGETELCEPI